MLTIRGMGLAILISSFTLFGASSGAKNKLHTNKAYIFQLFSVCPCLQFDKDVLTSLFSAIGKAVTSAPDSLTPKVLAALFEAQTLTLDRMGAQGPKLPDQVGFGLGVWAQGSAM